MPPPKQELNSKHILSSVSDFLARLDKTIWIGGAPRRLIWLYYSSSGGGRGIYAPGAETTSSCWTRRVRTKPSEVKAPYEKVGLGSDRSRSSSTRRDHPLMCLFRGPDQSVSSNLPDSSLHGRSTVRIMEGGQIVSSGGPRKGWTGVYYRFGGCG